MSHVVLEKPTFRSRVLQMREEAVVDAVHRLLSSKGYESMTVDEVAAEAGIAKASLYKHFDSKEALATAAMVAALHRGKLFVESQSTLPRASQRLKVVVQWMMQLKLAGEMPNLPSRNSELREVLMASREYRDALLGLSDTLGAWIEQAQRDGDLDASIPPLVILYTIYARACDPVLEFLRDSGLYSDEQILEYVGKTCFDGLCARAKDALHSSNAANRKTPTLSGRRKAAHK